MSTQILGGIYEADAYAPEVTITKTDGSALDLSGATVEAAASRGSTTHEATCTITDAAAGKVVAEWPAWTFDVAVWNVQVRVTPSGDGAQTVVHGRLTVSKSVFTAP